MYIKLTFKFISWMVAYAAAGTNAILANKPEIVHELPNGATVNKHSEKLKSFMTKELVQAGYYHDCKELTIEQVEKALDLFAQHYHNYNDNKLPGTLLIGLDPNGNEIINNLEIALEKVRNNTENAFLSVYSADDGEEQLAMATC